MPPWKGSLMRKRRILVFSIACLLLFAGCGKKGPPVPERLLMPGGVKDLAGDVKDGVLFLSFTMPTRDSAGRELKDLGGFRILKNCSTCVGGFEPWKEIRLEEKQGYTMARGKVFVYDDDLKVGNQYSYRVYPMSKMGTPGDGSNIFRTKWEAVPPPPGPISAKADNGKVELTWAGKKGLLYNVYKPSDHAYPLFPANPGPLTTPFFVDSGLQNGKTYQYEVRAVEMKAGSAWEGEGTRVTATPRDTTPPAAPLGVKTEKKGKGILITWRMNTEPDLLGYNVYRVSSGRTEKLNREPVKEPEYLDTQVPDVRYVSYYVTALDVSGNESEKSKESIIILMKE